jgi:hypothetical protein
MDKSRSFKDTLKLPVACSDSGFKAAFSRAGVKLA